ncbi:MAG: alpha/beta hydrolase fold domain-containing protein [Thermoguttaceae bacterium]
MRRCLQFDNLDQVTQGIRLLQSRGNERGGNRTLDQICDHLTIFAREATEGLLRSVRSWKVVMFCLLALSLADVALGQPKTQPGNPRALPPGVKVERNIAYVENGHERNRLDLYLPEKSTGRLPLVVWIHGGAWRAGSKEYPPALWLVGRGYAVASINYRFSQHALFPAQIEDCKAAIRWLKAHAERYSIDPDHIGVWGASAGGHLVALLGTTAGVRKLEGSGGNAEQTSRVQAVVDWFGPADMATMGGQAEPPDSPVAQLIGGPAAKYPEKARQASPLTYVSKDSAPMLIMHGDQDTIVPLDQSERLAAALKKAGVEARLNVIHGNGHGGPGFDNEESRKLIESFFDEYLKAEGK